MDLTDLEYLNTILDRDTELRDKIKDNVHEFEKKTRLATGALNKIHATPTDDIPKLVDSVRPMLQGCTEPLESLASLIPENEYWRYAGLFTSSIRSAVFASLFVEYLDSGALLSHRGVSATLGFKPEWENRLSLQAEDYLHGLISLVNELSRWAINSVTLGDYERPIRISIFVKDIFAGFSMLNLKNDSLRKRFDSLKYDIKKIEEVVYDVSLRRLVDPSRVVGASTVASS